MNHKKCSFIGLFLILALFLGTFSQNALAQESQRKNKIKVSYGDALYTSFALDMINGITGGNFFDNDDISTPGSFTASYRRLLNGDRWSVGGDFTYIPFQGKSKNGSTDNLDMFLIMPAVECYYIKSGLVRLYGTASAGLNVAKDCSGFAFQVNPVALRIGNNKIAGFAEIGVGFKGLFNVGLEIGF